MKVKGMYQVAEITFRKNYTYYLFANEENTLGKVIGYDYDFDGVDSGYIFKTKKMPYWQAENLWETIKFGVNVYYGKIPNKQELHLNVPF